MVARGILPAEIKSLVDSRREVKKLMNDPKISNILKEQASLFYLKKCYSILILSRVA
jgi:hypothetical protein